MKLEYLVHVVFMVNQTSINRLGAPPPMLTPSKEKGPLSENKWDLHLKVQPPFSCTRLLRNEKVLEFFFHYVERISKKGLEY